MGRHFSYFSLGLILSEVAFTKRHENGEANFDQLCGYEKKMHCINMNMVRQKNAEKIKIYHFRRKISAKCPLSETI